MEKYPLSPKSLSFFLFFYCHSFLLYCTTKLISSCHALLSCNFTMSRVSPSVFILFLTRNHPSGLAARKHVLVLRIKVAQRPVVLVSSVREMQGYAY